MKLQDLDAIAAVCRQVIDEALDQRERAIRADFPVVNVAEIAKETAALIPKPQDGKDAEISQEDLRKAISGEVQPLVAAAVSEIPIPQDGKDADIDLISSMVREEVASAVSNIPTPKDGESVPLEAVEQMVEKAVAGIEVVVPEPENGRDALDIEVLPGIDPDKSYPRGTYAAHKGGLWRSFQQTAGMRGWEAIVNGVAETRIERADERTFRLCVAHSDGTQISQDYRMPFGIFRGYYKEDQDYLEGDFTSRGGSVWCAKCDNPQTAPGMGNSEDWQLVVKKGRDGKNLEASK